MKELRGNTVDSPRKKGKSRKGESEQTDKTLTPQTSQKKKTLLKEGVEEEKQALVTETPHPLKRITRSCVRKSPKIQISFLKILLIIK